MYPILFNILSLFVSIDESIKDRPYMVVYPIVDLMKTTPNFSNVPDLILDFNSTSKLAGNPPKTALNGVSPDELISLIQNTIEPEIWGSEANITYFRGSLLVTAPYRIHEMLK
jgi:hypothetical protein